ncbi:MAG: cytochrome ubiquinol oxidase subunit I [Sulfobacillus benefaciens]|uniref:Cytochrome c oxidase subunit 1 n=1 Tax=Sulfobacillus benefaciens TaxID=453960 RepID=A0A2T2WTQ4_9FIRM|nr:MAG: cytochrome ubiquinol oxidase subunit I [Sulfobacillus benefaciens]
MSQILARLFPPQTRRPDEVVIEIGIVLSMLFLVYMLTRLKKWGWLWREWLTSVDHKKIGIMYLVSALLMLFRGGVDALMIRSQLALPNNHLLPVGQYDELFTTHGTIMIFFMAMPFLFALFNVAIPLMIGARDVAFPRLNAISFWLFAAGAILFNISFVVGGSPNAGWTAYPPLTELRFNPGVGENYYLVSLLIAGIGTTITGINFMTTILRMRAPGMTLMRMPMFVWTVLVTGALIVFAFPPLTIALLLTLLDRLFGSSFFTLGHGGMPMQFVNLFWLFGHPEVYIVVLPAFGIFSEVVPVFSDKKLFGYPAMVGSVLAITLLSYVVWVHHFFTMGAGPSVNAFFGVSTMLIAIPTGVKIFNWVLTMWGGRIRFTVAMLWQLAFIPAFLVAGATGVLLATVPVDYQMHNSYFLIAHFHLALIGGTVFGVLSGMYYWWPKMFGFMLNERQGKWAFWIFVSGFFVTFVPQYMLGFEGMTRRMYTYPAGLGWGPLNMVSTIGAFVQGLGFLVLVYNVLWSMRYGERDLTGDPWNGRTLEWSLPSPAPSYNFAVIPAVTHRDEWWEMKQSGKARAYKVKSSAIRPIHMPKRSAMPFFLGVSFFVVGFGMVFSWWVITIIGALGVIASLLFSAFDYNDSEEIDPEDVRRSEASLGRLEI